MILWSTLLQQGLAFKKLDFIVKTIHAWLTSKLCAEVWRTEYKFSLNPGNENSKLEMKTQKFPVKIDFNFHCKSSNL